MQGLIGAAVEFARARGAQIIEAYPVEPGEHGAADPWAYTGIATAFRKAGFREVLRRSEKRPIMRHRVLSAEC